MMRLAVEGLGVVAAGSNGLDALSWRARQVLGGTIPEGTDSADTGMLTKYLPVRALRRMDHFTRMTLLAAFEALRDAGLEHGDLADTGIILATGYGPAALTFEFLDSIIDYGPDMASPLAFAHSVHNIPAATVALSLKLTGPCTTVSQIDTAFPSALLTARTWLQEGRVTRVLLGAADERTNLLSETANRLATSHAGRHAGRRHLAPGDGAVFFCLHTAEQRTRHGFIHDVMLGTAPPEATEMPTFLSGCLTGRADPPDNTYALAPVYGALPTAMAFDTALALLAVNGHLTPAMPESPGIRCTTRDRFGLHGSLTVRTETA